MFDFFTNEMMAIAVPALVFGTAIILIVRKLIGFLILITLLLFTLISGFAIANYDYFKEKAADHGYSSELEKLEESVDGFRQQAVELLEGLRAEVDLQQENLKLLQFQTEQIAVLLEMEPGELDPFYLEETAESMSDSCQDLNCYPNLGQELAKQPIYSLKLLDKG